MAQVRICDRCGSKESKVIVQIYNNQDNTEYDYKSKRELDLCDTCIKKFTTEYMGKKLQ